MTCLTDTHFINKIRFNPGEMIHPLIYADWLEEQGDPKSELVRKWVAAAESDDPDVWRDAVEEIVGLKEPWRGLEDLLTREISIEVAWANLAYRGESNEIATDRLKMAWKGKLITGDQRDLDIFSSYGTWSSIWCCHQSDQYTLTSGVLCDVTLPDLGRDTSVSARNTWAMFARIHASFNLFGFNALPGSFREEIGDL